MPISSHRISMGRFAATRWSIAMRTTGGDDTDAQGALVELVQRYWYPVYAYARRCGHSAAIAEDIARTFLGQLLCDFRDGIAQRGNGHFRRFLLERLNTFLGGDWRDAVDARPDPDLVAPNDLETRYRLDGANAASPESAYQRGFALEVIARALKRLRREAARTGHEAMYDALEPHLTRDPGPGEYELLAQRLDSRPLALVMALKRLRQRLRELVGDELADTVTSSTELADEQTTLHTILRGTREPQ